MSIWPRPIFTALLMAYFLIINLITVPSFAASHFLALADIHFDPLYTCHYVTPCPLAKKLQQAPANQWPALFAAYDVGTQAYGQDTNYPLLITSLTAAQMAADANGAQFVLVLGDFLVHDFRGYYKQYTHDKTRAGFQAFVKKTLEFLTLELNKTFPTTNVYAVVGNNDTYQYDYVSDPNGEFFKDMSMIWSSLIKNKTSRLGLQQDFPPGGYYAVDIPGESNFRLIVLNTVLFSDKAYGKGINQAANAELDWLHNQLERVKAKNQQALIAMHIPMGIDVDVTLNIHLTLIEFWERQYTSRFKAELQQFSPEIAGILAGHLHSDWFQRLKVSNANDIPQSCTPSISPIFGNNPGFKIYRYSPQTLSLNDYLTYYDPLSANKAWGQEYDFNPIYQSNCRACPIANSQPITNKWVPYYWCAIHETGASEYSNCMD
jgi:sphingomyelin phosphodiesterase acid-like 3